MRESAKESAKESASAGGNKRSRAVPATVSIQTGSIYMFRMCETVDCALSQYNAPGFMPNVRLYRQFGLGVIELAQVRGLIEW